ncbi:MAG: [FeFe] hydrogenase H-cluster maturation GTPase HydF [Treponema sp.]|jgi:[FeFe] hydrogenase H-cluster maturation GTPase HydF|nr:[FeFe] hydrogenase H-cluster maturation GTPase HydF [Treponema sp.]
MGLNDTPSGDRLHIGFFGRRNAGKSSVVNAVTGQDLSIVSDIKGTTTDPVYKAMELLPLGPVTIIDTPGIDDTGELGEQRVRKARQVLNKTDVAVLVADVCLRNNTGLTGEEEELIRLFKAKEVKYLVAWNKSDLLSDSGPLPAGFPGETGILISAKTRANIDTLKERIAALAAAGEPRLRIAGDLINPSDFVVLVTPIDKAAPKGRLILPQQQTIRDILEADAAAIVVKEYELRETLEYLGKKPALVITDSQVFAKAAADTPPDIPLTSFSILFARYKGFLTGAVRGVRAIDSLTDDSKVLICEGCTHHRQCDDIGTVKLPRWLRNYTGKRLDFSFTSGGEFPDDLSPYRAVLHCGGCMLNDREMRYRQNCARDQGTPFTNYGIAIAHIQGILKRSIAIFPHLLAELTEIPEE